MDEFDFEELDKAVAGALGEKTTPSNTPAPATQPEPAIPPVREATPTVPERTPSSPSTRRSASGRFMDMVHPTSDMRSPRSVAPRPTPTTMHQEPETPLAQSKATPVSSETNADNATSEVSETPQPLESPFLPDAKVEKRPLGGTAPFEADAPKVDLVAELNLDTPTDIAPEPTISDAESSESEVTPTPEPTPEPSVEPSVEPAAEESARLEAIENTVPSESQTTDDSAVPGSIQPQYEAQPSSQAVTGAIYDTEAYHKPVAATSSKKSSLLTIVWVIVLIIIGAAAGAGFYLYILPLL